MSFQTSIECVLFDLDGTLINTAPDFIQVVNKLLEERGRTSIDSNLISQTVSDGARALVKLAFTIEEDAEDAVDEQFSAEESDMEEDFNQEVEEELLDIPTFLRRQAN